MLNVSLYPFIENEPLDELLGNGVKMRTFWHCPNNFNL